jgi:hypothetical protein
MNTTYLKPQFKSNPSKMYEGLLVAFTESGKILLIGTTKEYENVRDKIRYIIDCYNKNDQYNKLLAMSYFANICLVDSSPLRDYNKLSITKMVVIELLESLTPMAQKEFATRMMDIHDHYPDCHFIFTTTIPEKQWRGTFDPTLQVLLKMCQIVQ